MIGIIFVCDCIYIYIYLYICVRARARVCVWGACARVKRYNAFNSGLLNIAAVLVFGLHYKDRDFYSDPYGWSFVLACVCGAVTLLLGLIVLLIIAFFGKKNSRQADDNRYASPTEETIG